MRGLNPLTFIASVLIYIVSIYLSSLRWMLLIPHHLGVKRLFSMYMIGAFFNTCMPGVIGGDAIKIFYLRNELKKRNLVRKGSSHSENSISIASVFMDRYTGFVALLSIAIAAFPFGFRYIQDTPVKWLVPLFITTFFLVSIAVFKFRVGERVQFLFKVYEHFAAYRSNMGALLKCFYYSMIIQLLNIIAVYILSKGLSIDISFTSLLVFIPIITVISFIPVSISGIGLREGAFAFLFGLTGVPVDMAVTLSLIWFLSIITASLWGLFEYLRFKTVLGGNVE